MQSELWNLTQHNWVKGTVIAFLTPMLAALANAMNVPGFDFMTYDWQGLLMLGITGVIGYLAASFASDKNGKFMGKIG